MNAYIDSSVALRVLLRAPNSLAAWQEISVYISSPLLSVECSRTLERFRLAEGVPVETISRRKIDLDAMLRPMHIVAMTARLLDLAAGPFPVSLKTLDAIHLASAIVWRDRTGEALTFATHDIQLANAARSVGFAVVGA